VTLVALASRSAAWRLHPFPRCSANYLLPSRTAKNCRCLAFAFNATYGVAQHSKRRGTARRTCGTRKNLRPTATTRYTAPLPVAGRPASYCPAGTGKLVSSIVSTLPLPCQHGRVATTRAWTVSVCAAGTAHGCPFLFRLPARLWYWRYVGTANFLLGGLLYGIHQFAPYRSGVSYQDRRVNAPVVVPCSTDAGRRAGAAAGKARFYNVDAVGRMCGARLPCKRVLVPLYWR